MSGKLTTPYRNRTSTVVFKKTFEIPAVTVPYRNRTVFPLIRKRLYRHHSTDTVRYGQFPTHTKTALYYSYTSTYDNNSNKKEPLQKRNIYF